MEIDNFKRGGPFYIYNEPSRIGFFADKLPQLWKMQFTLSPHRVSRGILTLIEGEKNFNLLNRTSSRESII